MTQDTRIHNTETTTAWGNGNPLDTVLARIVHEKPSAVIEVSIGARPVEDPKRLLDEYRERYGMEFLAHHATPLLSNHFWRPTVDTDPHSIVKYLKDLRINRYSCHPPNAKFLPSFSDFISWANKWHDIFAVNQLEFAVETMYPLRLAGEVELHKGFHLSTPQQVEDFLKATSYWEMKPLLIDISHLNIGFHDEKWSNKDIQDLLSLDCYDEVHFSSNDGMRDMHRSLSEKDLKIRNWMSFINRNCKYVVDEGRK